MSRNDANELVGKLLLEYEDKIKNPPLGRTFQECYDLRTVRPSKEYLDIYEKIRKKLEDLGLSFSSC